MLANTVTAADDANADVGANDANDLGDGVGDAGVEQGCVCGSPFDAVGRVASRPGYPAEPASGLGPAGGYPSRLRSLRSLRAPLARRLASLTAVAGPTRSQRNSTAPMSSPPFTPCAGAARRARHRPRLSCPGRLRRLRAAPRLVAAALRASPVTDDARAPLSAPCRAVVPAPVRASPPSPPAACCAPLPATLTAPPAAQSPRRLRTAGSSGGDFPNLDTSDSAVPTARGRPRFSHPTHLRCPVLQARACPTFPCDSNDLGRLCVVGPSVCSRAYARNASRFSGLRKPVCCQHTAYCRAYPICMLMAYVRICAMGDRRVPVPTRQGRIFQRKR